MTPNFNWEFSKFGYSLKLLKASIPHLPSIHSPHQPRSLTYPPSIPHTNHDSSPTLHPFPTPTTIPHLPSIHSPHQPRSLTYPPFIPHADPGSTLILLYPSFNLSTPSPRSTPNTSIMWHQLTK